MTVLQITRADGPGRLFHLTARINWRTPHIADDGSKALLAGLLRESAESLGIRILAWVFMSNHLHIVVQSPPPALFARLTSRSMPSRHVRPWKNGHQNCSVLAQFMRRLRHRMSVLRQRELGLSGRFWESPYDARPIDDELSLAVRIAYDHRNPVKQSMVARPEDYPWSSARQWATGEPGPVPVQIEGPSLFGLSSAELRNLVLRFQGPDDIDFHSDALATVLSSPARNLHEDLVKLLQDTGLL